MAVTEYAVRVTTSTLDATGDHTAARLDRPILQQLQAVAGLCNAAEFENESTNIPLSERRIFGDATDQAILRFAESLGPVTALRKSWNTIFNFAFDSKNKFMIKAMTPVISQAPVACLSPSESKTFDSSNMYVLFQLQARLVLIICSLFTIKGAPDILINRCSQILCPDGELKPLSDVDLAAVKFLKDQWSSEGKRVILLARKVLAKESILAEPTSSEFETQMLREAKNGLTLVGLVGLIDPPRTEIPEVIRILRQARIRVFMVCILFENRED